MTKLAKVALFFGVASVLPLAAQAPAFDTSGNAQLNGTYYFRHVLYVVDTNADSTGVVGDISEAIALYGNITFDGNGHYAINNGIVSDSNVGQTDPLSCYLAQTTCAANAGTAVSGTYSVSASGFAFLSNPVVSGDFVFGLVAANGIFSGSSTETTYTYNDMFICAPVPSPLPVNSSFNGAYTVAGYLPNEDAFFQMNPNGAGSLGTVNVTGYYKGGNAATTSQSSNATYTFSNGAAIVTFPTSATANFFSGPEYFYFSPDGNFFFGGSPTDGYDMIVGIRNSSSTGSFGGLYYQAGIDQSFSDLSAGFGDFDGYYGAFNASPTTGNILVHERLNDQIFESSTYGWAFSDSFTPGVTGTYTDTGQSFQYAVGGGGKIRIGAGIGPYLGVSVAFQAPAFTPTGSVYINPTGVVNAASFAPFTAGIADGEFATIFGTNLAPGTKIASSVPYPTILNGVQVMINGVVPAPIYFVTSGQIAFIVPAATPLPLTSVQVINNGVSSNVVVVPVYPTVPGIYTNPSGGVYAAAVDANLGVIVTPSTPTLPGDTIEVFATGLGTAYPPVADGAAPPTSPLSYTTNTITADVDGTPATVQFAGLAPTLAGLYQINVTIPSTITAGDHFLNISGSNPTTTALQSYSQLVLISVGGGTAAQTSGETARSRRPRVDSSSRQRVRPCLMGSKPACVVEK